MNKEHITEFMVPEGGKAIDFLAGGGEMGALLRAHDWSKTPLGESENWPRSLRTALRIMLTSRQPIWIGWGKELIYFYNDAYKSIIGGKHPWALGRPVSEVWQEIWDDIAPMLDTAMGGVEGTYVEEQLLIMERNGYPEETYYTFSYSPVPDDEGRPGGIICANSDDTGRVIGERQLSLLRDLAASTADARSWRDACQRSAEAFLTNPRDLPFALIYLADPEGHGFSLATAAGIEPGHPAAPDHVSFDSLTPWPIGEVMRSHDIQIVTELASLGIELPVGVWDVPPRQAAILPITAAAETNRPGVLVVGLNPFRIYDERYGDFLGLAAGQIAAAIANAKAYEDERRRVETLAEIDRAKTLFFSNVSHEFRTPLTLMLGPLEELLASGAFATDSRVQVEVAHRNGLRLLKLVNSLLDFSRIEAGRVQVSFMPVDLCAFTAELASNFRSATDKAGLELVVECPSMPEPVYVDPDMWEKIVLNLISNAFKFTFEGSIRVTLEATEGMVNLTVRDTGTGIPDKELPRLFERFHRIDGARGRSFEGSGIGLALVQELVRLHGGTIRVESKEGEGSAFIISVPLGTAHLPAERIFKSWEGGPTTLRAHAYVEEALRWLPGGTDVEETVEKDALVGGARDVPATRTGERATILLAEDNADMRSYITRLLAPSHDIDAVPDGEAALDALRRRRPDLVLTDIMMPRLDGFGLLRAIRGDAALRDLPVIVLSARAGAEASIEGLAAGADDYLVKPFSARELIARVDSALTMARMRRQMNDMLRESEERFRNMADNAPVMIWTADPAGQCTYLSRSWYGFTGQTAETGLGLGWVQAVHPDDRERSKEIFFAANEAREPFSLEYRLRRRDGSYGWAIDAATPWFGADGEYLGFIGSVIDISERRQVEEAQRRLNELLEQRVAEAIEERQQAEFQLRQSQKMEAVGKLTGGVAHDFNNLLQVIGGNLQILAKDVSGNEQAERRLRNALAGVHRGAKLASQLLAFGRRQPLAPKVVNLGRLIRGLDDMLRRALGDGIEIETVISGGLWNTLIDPSQVESAILNLAINARDAMNGHGRLTVEAGNAALDDAYASIHDVSAGQYVMLAVSDTGCGIPPDLVDRVFEPFFTTKPEGQGTGLGLSMVYGFVKQSDGHIKIYSELGQGTTIRIYLPRVLRDEDVAIEVNQGPVAGGSETILVVEDDEDVRLTVVEMLSDLGYRVLKAKDAQSAFAIIESGVPIDLLFTDVVMPGPMRSPELARKARERLPDLAVLFTSGYTDNAIVHGGRLDEGIELLSKPYMREALARKVRHVLRDQEQRNPPAPAAALAPTPAPKAPPVNPPALPKTAEPGPQPAKAEDRPLRVLLVEDDMLIRFSTADMLAALGHTVFEAGTASEALAALEADEIDVLLTDIGLPGLSGVDLAVEALEKYPRLRVVFATGADGVDGMHRHPELAAAGLLRKPYDEAGLASMLLPPASDRPNP